MVGEGWSKKSRKWEWVSISRWIKDSGYNFYWCFPLLIWVRPVLSIWAWVYIGISGNTKTLPSCLAVPPTGVFCHLESECAILGLAKMPFWHQSKGWSDVCLLAMSQALNGSFFIHSVSKKKEEKAVCVSARPSCLGIPEKQQLQHRSSVEFGHRQRYSNNTSPCDAVLESTQCKKERIPAFFLLGCAIFECTPCMGLWKTALDWKRIQHLCADVIKLKLI